MLRPLWLIVFACGCAATSRLAPTLPDDTFVLLDPAATLYAEPSESAASFTLSSSEVAALRLRAQGAFHVYRLVRDSGNWLEVETPGPVDDQCAGPQPELVAFRLRLFARASDAVSATRRRVRLAFADGTAATLMTGTPLGADRTAFLGQAALRLELPLDAAGRSYRGGEWLETSGGQRFLPEDQLGMLMVGGTPLRPLVGLRPADGPMVAASHVVPAGTVLTLRTRCAELEALGAPELVKPIPQAPSSPVAVTAVLTSPYARAGAAIYWPNGRVAGELRREIDFLDETGASGGRRCFRWTPPARRKRADAAAILTFCFDPTDLR